MTDILQAARSYYGMDSTPVGKCEMYTNEHGSMRLVIEIPVTGDDFIAIGQRMKAMQEAESQQVEQAPVFGEDLDTHAMRQQYNALSKAERGKYGSFGVYMTSMSNGIIEAKEELANPIPMPRSSHNTEHPGRQVVHVDAPEEPEPVSMDAVWLHERECTEAQKVHASDYAYPRFYVQWAMLTDEQKAKAKEAKP